MVEKLVKETIKRPGIKGALPKFVSAKLLVDEMEEHFGFLRWSVKRVLLPLAAFYLVAGFVLGEHVFGSLVLALLVFLYTNFLPDLDTFFPHSADGKRNVGGVKKRIALFFAPAVIYYLLSRKLSPWDLGCDKPFHNSRALMELGVFLFVAGLLLYFSVLKALFFVLFGVCGYLLHLAIDGKIRFLKLGQKPIAK